MLKLQQEAPGDPEEASRAAVGSPGAAPRRPQGPPGAPQDPPDGPKTGPRRPKTAPRRPQDRPKTAQGDPRTAQSGPKTPPGRPLGPLGRSWAPQDRPGPPRDTPRDPPGLSKMQMLRRFGGQIGSGLESIRDPPGTPENANVGTIWGSNCVRFGVYSGFVFYQNSPAPAACDILH